MQRCSKCTLVVVRAKGALLFNCLPLSLGLSCLFGLYLSLTPSRMTFQTHLMSIRLIILVLHGAAPLLWVSQAVLVVTPFSWEPHKNCLKSCGHLHHRQWLLPDKA